MSCNPRAPSASPPLEDQHMYTLQSKASQCQSTNIGTSNAFQLPLATDEVAGSSNISIIVSEDPIAESSKRKLAVEENVTGNSSKKRTTRQATSERGELVNEPERLSVAMDTLDGKVRVDLILLFPSDDLCLIQTKTQYIFVPDFLSYGTRRGTFQSLIFTQRVCEEQLFNDESVSLVTTNSRASSLMPAVNLRRKQSSGPTRNTLLRRRGSKSFSFGFTECEKSAMLKTGTQRPTRTFTEPSD